MKFIKLESAPNSAHFWTESKTYFSPENELNCEGIVRGANREFKK